LLVPNSQLSTGKARKLLPESISHQDATKNTGRAALLVHALSVRPDLLFAATEDFLHQKFRREAMPKSVDLVNKLRGAGVAAVISGAGPSVLVLHNTTAAEHDDIIRSAGDSFRPIDVELSPAGAITSNA
jgi:homoserine kinase